MSQIRSLLGKRWPWLTMAAVVVVAWLALMVEVEVVFKEEFSGRPLP